MRKPDKESWHIVIDEFYERVHDLLKLRGIKWIDLAKLTGVSAKTLSSMKTQKINPSFITVKRIADALDVSIDELVNNKRKTKELYELEWAIPRLAPDPDVQGALCEYFLMLANKQANPNCTNSGRRNDICKEEIKAKLKAVNEGVACGPQILVTIVNSSLGEDTNKDK